MAVHQTPTRNEGWVSRRVNLSQLLWQPKTWEPRVSGSEARLSRTTHQKGMERFEVTTFAEAVCEGNAELLEPD